MAEAYRAEAALTAEELAAFARRDMARTTAAVPVRAAWRETALGILIAVGCAFAARGTGLVYDDPSAWAVGFVAVLGYGAGLLAMRALIARYYRDVQAFRNASSDFARQRRRYTLDGDGIGVEGETASARWSWRALTEVEEAEGLMLLWVGHAHGFALPLHAFVSPEEGRAALAFARERVAGSRGT